MSRERAEETEQKLRRSKDAARLLGKRTILCPVCGFRLLDVYGSGHYLIEVKCRKCKFRDTIDTALFRTVRHGKRNRLRRQ